MADRLITIAAATRTPLYLPLYVVALNHFLPTHKKYKILIVEPEDKTINGDRWAAAQVADRHALFAVCDPLAAKDVGGVCVVASVVNRAAFWFVSQGLDVHQLEQLAGVARIVTYPKHMTGYHVARFIASITNKRISVKDVPIDSEFDGMLASKSGGKAVVALTPNLISANRLLAKYKGESLRISPAWQLHSTLWTFMTTGLLTHRDTVVQQYELVTDLVAGLSKSSAMISVNPEFASQVLSDSYDRDSAPLTPAEAQQVVRQLQADRIHPPTPYPDITSWHNARLVRLQSAGRGRDSAPDTSYPEIVRRESAEDVERRFLKTLISYSEGELHNDIVVSLQRLRALGLKEMRVVGSYYRYEEQPRNILRDVIDKIRRALAAPATDFRVNFVIWGESSVGKSYLIEQFAEQNKTAIQFVHINVGKETKQLVAEKLETLQNGTGPRLCLIDEIDAKSSADWSYDLVFSRLDLRTQGAQVVFVFTGSTTESADALLDHIAKEYKELKGGDLETRIPIDGRVSIPPPILEDRIIIAAGQLYEKALNAGKRVSSVEKSALYYLLLKRGLGKPRHLSDLAGSSVARLPGNRESVRYDDLFDEADREKRSEFYVRHISAFEALGNAYVAIDE